MVPAIAQAPQESRVNACVEKGSVMSKNWIMLAGLLVLGPVGTQAHPLDAPDIVYIDGQPCNSACQNYLAWSWRKTRHYAPVESTSLESSPLKIVPDRPAARTVRSTVRRATVLHRDSVQQPARRIAKQVPPASPAKSANPQPPIEPAGKPEPAAPPIIVSSPSPEAAAVAPKAAATDAQAPAVTQPAAPAMAAMTPVPQQTASGTEPSVTVGAAETGNTASAEPAAPANSDNRVAVVMTRSEIESLSDLAGKDVAIEEQQSASSASIKAAIASAGAAEVRIDEGSVSAVDRLINGDVPAAVLAIASPAAAAQIPDMPGYRIFRIPLSPG